MDIIGLAFFGDGSKNNTTQLQVQQRGVSATKSIIMQLLDGMASTTGSDELLVVDLLPSRPNSYWQKTQIKLKLSTVVTIYHIHQNTR